MNLKLPLVASSIALATAFASAQALINEIEPNPGGSDPAQQSLELKGAVGATFSGFLLSIESDFVGGTVDRLYQLGGVFDANGLLTFSIDDLENPSFTLVLVDNFSGSTGDVVFDTDADGTVDWTAGGFGINTIYDAIGVSDNTADDTIVIGGQLGGADFVYNNVEEPVNIFRDGITNDWYAFTDNNGTEIWDLNGNSIDPLSFNVDPALTTFGGVNPTVVPEPATMAVLGLGALALFRRKRSK